MDRRSFLKFTAAAVAAPVVAKVAALSPDVVWNGGAMTGRFSSNAPNFSQIPKRSSLFEGEIVAEGDIPFLRTAFLNEWVIQMTHTEFPGETFNVRVISAQTRCQPGMHIQTAFSIKEVSRAPNLGERIVESSSQGGVRPVQGSRVLVKRESCFGDSPGNSGRPIIRHRGNVDEGRVWQIRDSSSDEEGIS